MLKNYVTPLRTMKFLPAEDILQVTVNGSRILAGHHSFTLKGSDYGQSWPGAGTVIKGV